MVFNFLFGWARCILARIAALTTSTPTSIDSPNSGLLVRLTVRRALVVVSPGEENKEELTHIFNQTSASGIAITVLCPRECIQHFTAEQRQKFVHVDLCFNNTMKELAQYNFDLVMFVQQHLDYSVCARLARDARARNAFVYFSGCPAFSDFQLLTVRTQGAVQIGVSTGGKCPTLEKRISNVLEHHVPKHAAAAVENMASLQRQETGNNHVRQQEWTSQILHFWPFEELAAMSLQQFQSLVRDTPAEQKLAPPSSSSSREASLCIVGAGPGDPDLLSVAAQKALREADLILSDKLACPLLDLVSPNCQIQVARKFPGNASRAQDELNEQGLAALREGKRVVRLHGGDPFVYGRGGEEVRWFREHGVKATVIPGLSSALTAPLLAGIPVTHRGLASQVLIVSGQNRHGALPVLPGWSEERTVVVLMGLGKLREIMALFERSGCPPSCAVAVVENASRVDQRVVHGTVATISELVSALQSPAAIIVGRVCRFPEEGSQGNEEALEE